jgi:hypothetical protein
MGAWLAVAQTNTNPPATPQRSGIQANLPVAAVKTGREKPVISVSTNTLEFGSVAVNGAAYLAFTVQNVGGGFLSGAATVSPPFSIVAGGIYSLTSNQSQIVTVQYAPKVPSMNITVVHLAGGGGAGITVAGSAVPAPPARPAPPTNLRIVAAL